MADDRPLIIGAESQTHCGKESATHQLVYSSRSPAFEVEYLWQQKTFPGWKTFADPVLLTSYDTLRRWGASDSDCSLSTPVPQTVSFTESASIDSVGIPSLSGQPGFLTIDTTIPLLVLGGTGYRAPSSIWNLNLPIILWMTTLPPFAWDTGGVTANDLQHYAGAASKVLEGDYQGWSNSFSFTLSDEQVFSDHLEPAIERLLARDWSEFSGWLGHPGTQSKWEYRDEYGVGGEAYNAFADTTSIAGRTGDWVVGESFADYSDVNFFSNNALSAFWMIQDEAQDEWFRLRRCRIKVTGRTPYFVAQCHLVGPGVYNLFSGDVGDLHVLTSGTLAAGDVYEIDFPAGGASVYDDGLGNVIVGGISFLVLNETVLQWSTRTGIPLV